MPSPFGVNLRVTGYCSQGGRKYMEDSFSVAYQRSTDHKHLEYAFFGVYDGHGGSEAANFAREHLMDSIVEQKLFWSDNDDDVLRAIREGYIATHYAMWREQDKWSKTATGLPSTAGTTATVAFVRRGKIYVGHVGDSGIVLGYQEEGEDFWRAQPLTQDHKPECNIEKQRIINSGGKVVIKSGVPRVVWNRPRLGHKGPVRRSTPIDEIPFLAVARSLGDLWSYNSALNEFVVSPDPDVHVINIDTNKFRCLVFGTDGLWNVVSAKLSVEYVRVVEELNGHGNFNWDNPSKCLVDVALEKWLKTKMRADNISVVTIMLYPPGAKPNQHIKPGINFCDENSLKVNNPYSLYNQHHEMYNPHHDDVLMYDHECNELITMGNACPPIAQPISSSLNLETMVTRYDKTNEDICYMNSFAESYNSLFEHSLYGHPQENLIRNPHPLQQHQTLQQGSIDDINFNPEPYLLTKLQTRTEQLNAIKSNYGLEDCSSSSGSNSSSITNNSNTTEKFNSNKNENFMNGYALSLNFHDYHRLSYTNNYENDGDGYSQFNSISSSYENEKSEDINLLNKLTMSYENDVPQNQNKLMENENLDESIQINEITSSISSCNSVITSEHLISQKTIPITFPPDPSTTLTLVNHKIRTRSSHTSPILEPPVTRSKELLGKKLLLNYSTKLRKLNSRNINLRKTNLKPDKTIIARTKKKIIVKLKEKVQIKAKENNIPSMINKNKIISPSFISRIPSKRKSNNKCISTNSIRTSCRFKTQVQGHCTDLITTTTSKTNRRNVKATIWCQEKINKSKPIKHQSVQKTLSR